KGVVSMLVKSLDPQKVEVEQKRGTRLGRAQGGCYDQDTPMRQFALAAPVNGDQATWPEAAKYPVEHTFQEAMKIVEKEGVVGGPSSLTSREDVLALYVKIVRDNFVP